MPSPPKVRAADNPWPQFARVSKIDYGHAEAAKIYGLGDPRQYCVLTKEFVSTGAGNVKGVHTIQVEWTKVEGKWKMHEISGTERFYQADLVLIALGFLGPEKSILEALSVNQDLRSNILTPKGSYATSVPGVFAAGDCRRGQSLIVWGINEGRQAAREIDIQLQGNTRLPVCGGMVKRPIESLSLINMPQIDGAGLNLSVHG